MLITIPELALVVLVGASSSGKSTFARQHFKPTEILSSDTCRALVSDDENNQEATTDAFEVLYSIAEKRLRRGLLTVIDATNVQPFARKSLVKMAQQYHVEAVALVFDLPAELITNRHLLRPDRHFDEYVLHNHRRDLHQSLSSLPREGFGQVYVMKSPEEVRSARIQRTPLPSNRKAETGPFDLIGDIHGCYEELLELLEKLGYGVEATDPDIRVTPPPGRKAIFLGDLVDRGPASPRVLRLVMGMVAAGTALCVPGNHDEKLLRKLNGKNIVVNHGLAQTLEQLAGEPRSFGEEVRTFLSSLPSHYVLDGGRLVVAHAGLKEAFHGRESGAVRSFCLFGDTTGETDRYGLPVRRNWALQYQGAARIVYGHTPVWRPEWVNNTIDIDTGCVFGGSLTALRYPELALVSVPARRVYWEPARPFLPPADPGPSQASVR